MEKISKAKIIKALPYFGLILVIIAIVWLVTEIPFFGNVISRFFRVISPFVAGAMLAYILNMPTSAIQRLLNKTKVKFINKRSRPLSVLILVIIIFLLVEAVVLLVFPAVRSSILFFISQLPIYQQNLRFIIDWIRDFTMPEFMVGFLGEDFSPEMMLQNIVSNFHFETVIMQTMAGIGGIGTAVFRGVLAVITSIYFLLEKDRFKAFVYKLVIILTAEKTSRFILKYSRKLDFYFRQYVFVQTIDGMILGTLMIIALLVFRSPFALVLGLMLGIFNYVPYFGSLFGTIIAVIVVAFTQDLQTAAIVAIVMFIIQQLDGNVIQPKLMSESFAISPLLVVIGVTVGGAYGDILGMLMAIPIVTVIKDMIDSFVDSKRITVPPIEESKPKKSS
ncbi:MAG: AI-2E family transporter [Lachnospiraceae bacterium]|nr:AI-2E family transporter [Lachnospiraceae bacterium]